MNTIKVVRAPLRISLVGGGSDLPSHYETWGGSVISAAIDKYVYITAKPVSPCFQHRYRLVYSKIEEHISAKAIEHPIIAKLVEDYEVTSLDLDVMSDVPAGTGLGSSSAFTCALHTAFSSLRRMPYPLARLACKTEIDDLKEPIGKQDQYASAFGGLNKIEFTRNRVYVDSLAPHSSSLRPYLNLLYMGGKRSASLQLSTQNPKNKTYILNQLSGLAHEASCYIKDSQYGNLGPLITEGWELKKQLSPNITTDQIDRLINVAIQNGATGGKLLGAGGAGFVLLFVPPEDRLRVLESVSDLHLGYLDFNFDNEGCKVLYEG